MTGCGTYLGQNQVHAENLGPPAGYPIAAVKGPDGGYRLSAGTALPPLLFDDEQAVALTIALQIAATTQDSGLAEAAERALHTIRQVLPSRLRHRVNALSVTAVEPPTTRPAEPVDGGVLLAISAAAHAHEILRFDYGADPADRAARRAEPHHVVTRGGRWSAPAAAGSVSDPGPGPASPPPSPATTPT